MREYAIRLPFAAYGLMIVFLSWLAPGQLIHIADSVWQDGGTGSMFLVIGPVILATILHVAIVSMKSELRPAVDSFLCIVPFFATLWVLDSTHNIPLLVKLLAASCLYMIVWRFLLALKSNGGRSYLRNDHVKRLLVTSLVIVIWLLVLVGLYLFPVGFSRWMGLGVVTTGLGLIWITIALLSVRPFWGLIYLICILISPWLTDNSHQLRTIHTENGVDKFFHVNNGFREWLNLRNDLATYRDNNRPYPVIIASSAGGGIYAAAHSYLALSRIQSLCPSFSQHLFATIGVSGGAIGNLLFSNSISKTSENTDLTACRSNGNEIDKTPVTADLLSPVLANLLIVQAADFFVPFLNFAPDGGEILSKSINSILPNHELQNEPLKAAWHPTGSRPAQVFVTTDVENGNRFLFTSISELGADTAEHFPYSDRDIPSTVAAVTSARFPWLTSSALLEISENNYRSLADGGYFDNSGADTVVDLVNQLKTLAYSSQELCKRVQDENPSVYELDTCCAIYIEADYSRDVSWNGCSQHIFIAHFQSLGAQLLNIKYENEANLKPKPQQSYLLDPFKTLLSTRRSREGIALSRSRRHIGGVFDPDNVQVSGAVDKGHFYHYLPIEKLQLPLGWRLTKSAISEISELTPNISECPAYNENATGYEFLEGSNSPSVVSNYRVENACNMALLAWLFNPSLDLRAVGVPWWE